MGNYIFFYLIYTQIKNIISHKPQDKYKKHYIIFFLLLLMVRNLLTVKDI